jgi:hypothetical protein
MRSSANHETLVFADDDYILITQAIAAASSSSGDRELRDSLPSNREPLSNTLEQSCLQNKDLASSKTYQDGNSRGRTRTIIAQLFLRNLWSQKFSPLNPKTPNPAMASEIRHAFNPKPFNAKCLSGAMLVKPSQNASFTKTLSLPWHTPEDEKTCSESESEDDFQVQKMNHQSNSTEPSPRRCAWISDPRLIANREKKKLVTIILRTRSRTSYLGHRSTDLRAGKKKHSVHSETPHLQKHKSKSGKKAAKMPQNKRKKQRKTQKTHNRTNKHTHTHTGGVRGVKLTAVR